MGKSVVDSFLAEDEITGFDRRNGHDASSSAWYFHVADLIDADTRNVEIQFDFGPSVRVCLLVVLVFPFFLPQSDLLAKVLGLWIIWQDGGTLLGRSLRSHGLPRFVLACWTMTLT